MKVLLLLSFVALLTGCSSSSESSFDRKTKKIQDLEAFSMHVFSIVQSGDYDKLVALQPDFEELKQVVQNSTLNEDEKQRELISSENQLKQDISSFKKSYEDFQEEIELQSINLKESTFNYLDFEHTRKDKIEKANISIHFKFKGADYYFNIKNCVKHQSTWLLGSSINIYKPYSRYDYWRY